MQTFLPYPSFPRSAHVLDNKRLGKQRSEVLIILRALNDPSYGWQNHPAVRMWRGYDQALVEYGVIICMEWRQRGFKDQTAEKIAAFGDETKSVIYPPWIGDVFFHRAHQSNLLRKDKAHYDQFFVRVPENLPYLWPIP